MASFPQASPPTPCAHLYPPPHAPHALPISFVSILPPAQYWVRSTDHSAPRYAACSYSPVTSSLLGPNTFLNTLFSNTLSLRSSLYVSDQVSHPYKTTGKIIVLYILIFKFLDSARARTHTHTHTQIQMQNMGKIAEVLVLNLAKYRQI